MVWLSDSIGAARVSSWRHDTVDFVNGKLLDPGNPESDREDRKGGQHVRNASQIRGHRQH